MATSEKAPVRLPSAQDMTRLLLAVALAGCTAWALVALGRAYGFSPPGLAAIAREGDTFLILILVIVGPVFGFPVSLCLLLLGYRFGFLGGMGMATISLGANLLISYYLAQGRWSRRLRSWLSNSRWTLPKLREKRLVAYTALVTLVPGPSFTAKNYLLALSNIPLSLYFWVGWPLHVATSVVLVGAGRTLAHFHPELASALVVGAILVYILLRMVEARLAEELES